MKKAGYTLGFAAALWLLYALWVRVMTFADVGPAMHPHYERIAPLIAPQMLWLWLLASAALAGCAIVRLFRGRAAGAERVAALTLALLALVATLGWAVLTALVAAA